MISNISGWSWCWKVGSNIVDKVMINGPAAVSVFVAVLVTSWYLMIMRWRRNGEKLLPPGPRGLPLVGNLFSLEPDLHLYFAKLSQVYGPIVKVHLGRKPCVVVSSSSLTKEILKHQDATFADRDSPFAALIMTYGGADVGWGPCDTEWRKLRKICTQGLLSKANLDSCYELRRREVIQTMRNLYNKIETPVNVGDQVFITTLNSIMNMLWGGTLQGEERATVGAEFRQVVTELVEVLGKPNVSDIFPILRRFDIQGIERKTTTLLGWLDRIFKTVIDQRMRMNESKNHSHHSESNNDFLQFLLELMVQKDAKTQITMNQLKALFLDFVVAGSDTTSTTLEWAMTEMMQHPEMMRKAQEELDEVVGTNNMVEESHVSKLHYLDAIVKETFRLHPVVPLLVPRSPSSSCRVGGYTIPKGAKVLFNVWAMHRDPAEWDNALEFRPERFLGDANKMDYRGSHFNYLPFGAGRRMCVGIPLAERMTKHILASFLHSFEWQLPEGTKLDLSEKFGIVLKKSTPLIVIPSPRFTNLPELYN